MKLSPSSPSLCIDPTSELQWSFSSVVAVFAVQLPYCHSCSLHRSEESAASDDSPRQAELPYPMSAWTWDSQEAAAAWMVVPTGNAGLGLQVSASTSTCWFWSFAEQSWSGTASLSLLCLFKMLTQGQMLFVLH